MQPPTVTVISIHRWIDAEILIHSFPRKKPAKMKVEDQSKPPVYAYVANTGYLSSDVPATRALRCLTPGMKYPMKSPHFPFCSSHSCTQSIFSCVTRNEPPVRPIL